MSIATEHLSDLGANVGRAEHKLAPGAASFCRAASSCRVLVSGASAVAASSKLPAVDLLRHVVVVYSALCKAKDFTRNPTVTSSKAIATRCMSVGPKYASTPTRATATRSGNSP